MKRRLNVKFLAWLVVGAVLAGGGLHALQVYQTRRHLKAYLVQADLAEKRGQRPRAIGYLSRYLGFRPDDVDALARYGRMIEDFAKTPRERAAAVQPYEQVLRLDPRRGDLRLRLVRIEIGVGLYGPALDQLKHFLTKAPPPGTEAELEGLRGRCYEGQGKYEAAVAEYQKAIKRPTAEVDDYARLALLLRRHLQARDPDPARVARQADAVMDQMVRSHGRSERAYLARARYRRQFGLPGADDDVARARGLAPDDPEVAREAARVELARVGGGPDAARRILERSREAHPGDAGLYQALAELELRAGRPEPAESWLVRGLKQAAEPAALEWALAHLLILEGKAEKARPLVEHLRKGPFPAAPLDYLDAYLLVLRGDWQGASRALERLLPGLAPLPDLAAEAEQLLGRCFEQLSSPELRLKALRQAVADRPASAAFRLDLAAALAADGRLDAALAEYARLAPEVPAARLPLARLLVGRNLQQPEGRRNWPEAVAALDAASQAAPRSAEVSVLRARALAALGQPDDARRLLEQECARQPDRVEPWAALAELAQQQGGTAPALAVLDRAEAQLKDTEAAPSSRAALRLARAQVWARRGGPEARAALAPLTRDLDGFPDAARASLRRGLAELAAAVGDVDDARRLWSELAAQRPKDLQPRLMRLDLAIQSGDVAELDRAVDDLRRFEGDRGAFWRYGDALRELHRADRGPGARPDVGRIAAARRRLAEIAEMRPDWPRVPQLRGRIAELEGDADRAIADYQRAIDLGDRQPAVARRLVGLLYRGRRFDEADRAIRTLQEQAPLDGDLRRLAAEVALQAHDPGRAVALAREAVAPEARDYRDQLWLGRIYEAAGQPVEAVAAFRRAVERAGDAPEAWLALVQHLARAGQDGLAAAALDEARAKLPPDRATRALAAGYELIGRPDEASQQYRKALEAEPDDPALLHDAADFDLRAGRPDAAEPLLRRLIEPGGKVPPEVAAWARRSLAVDRATRGGRPGFDEAMALLRQGARPGAAPAPEDRRAEALVLATQVEPARRRRAIELLEGLAKDRLLGPAEQFLLARLDDAEPGRWPKARDLMLGLLAAHGDEPTYLVFYVDGLLRHGEAADAEAWLARLEALAPEAIQAVGLRARTLQARGQHDEAVRRLRDYAAGHEDRELDVARLLEAIDAPDDAGALYRRFVDRSKAQQPQAVLVLAEFLGRRGKVDEALDLCDAAWEAGPPEPVATTCATILDEAKADAAQCRRVEARLDRALGQAPDAPALLVPLAILRSAQGRTDEAEAVYRRILGGDPGNVAALNNLAWLLALGGRADEALEQIDRAIAAAGPRAALLDTRAVARLATGRDDAVAAAIQDLEDALRQDRSAAMYFHLARAQLLAKRPDAARAALKMAEGLGLRAAALDPPERPAYDRLRDALRPTRPDPPRKRAGG